MDNVPPGTAKFSYTRKFWMAKGEPELENWGRHTFL